jgi:hypothetical protein
MKSIIGILTLTLKVSINAWCKRLIDRRAGSDGRAVTGMNMMMVMHTERCLFAAPTDSDSLSLSLCVCLCVCVYS